jgi:hypothetical protein
VLDTFLYADKQLLQVFPDLLRAKVYVHFQSDVQVRVVDVGGRGPPAGWQGRSKVASKNPKCRHKKSVQAGGSGCLPVCLQTHKSTRVSHIYWHPPLVSLLTTNALRPL